MSGITLARPYARAAFGYARAEGALDAFAEMLALAAAFAADAHVRTLLSDPRLTRARRSEMLAELGGERFDAPMRNFLQALGERDRLALLPEVARQFEQLRAAHERRLTAEVVSARELDATQKNRIREDLEASYDQTVDLAVRIDEQLLGGAVVRAGDQVLDASLRGRLQQLAQSLA